MNHSRPANIPTRHEARQTSADYKAMAKAIIDQIEDPFIHRMIYEIVRCITAHIDKFTR